ncbi:MAG: succinyl-diaminopimelate desuccinylase, partial [Alphaproteobacteria bacterium]|nr:succinyl-diaminopimelate desuccinylase [Alphaproteobacteria bacterium]
VVPVGDAKSWSADPFGAEIVEGRLFGRGAVDMKSAVACFAAAVSRLLAERGRNFKGSISLLITNDEEGISINGTKKVLAWMAGRGEKVDASLVGEPTNARQLGDMAKIGRRGNLNAYLTVFGAQGHTAYPHLADNPIPRAAQMLAAITSEEIDKGNAHFQPTILQVTSVDVGNPALNVIPAKVDVKMNSRFNTLQTPETLERWLRTRFDAVGGKYDLRIEANGDAFLTPPGALSELVQSVVHQVLGRKPELTTTGGTSDARFIKDFCPVIEFGLVGQTMHKVDENTPVAEIVKLADIYKAILDGYFPE